MEKDNKLIAEFMGMTNDVPHDKSMMVRKTPQGNEVVPIDSLQYHSSWDWLMPVISKITKDERCVENEYRESIMDVVPYGNIEDTIKTVVEFIKDQNN